MEKENFFAQQITGNNRLNEDNDVKKVEMIRMMMRTRMKMLTMSKGRMMLMRKMEERSLLSRWRTTPQKGGSFNWAEMFLHQEALVPPKHQARKISMNWLTRI